MRPKSLETPRTICNDSARRICHAKNEALRQPAINCLILETSPRLSSVLLLCLLAIGVSAAESKRVTLVRTPEGGIQPQAAVDGQDVVHLIYFKGDAKAGNIFYVRQEPGRESFSNPIQVNSQQGSAIAAGTIRGAQLAVGKNGRVHVVAGSRKERTVSAAG